MANQPSKPRYVPSAEDRKMVQALASFGHPQEEIAEYIGIAPKTLRKHFREELGRASVAKNVKVAAYVYRLASAEALKDADPAGDLTHADCLRAAMFWLKTRAGWTDKRRDQEVERAERRLAAAIDTARGVADENDDDEYQEEAGEVAAE